MTAFLPPNLLALFAARDPIPYLPPVDKLGHEKKRNDYGGVAVFSKDFEDPKDTPPPTRVETKDERKERKRKERAEQIAYKLEQDLALWDPHAATTSTDPYKSLFVARINYDTSESKIRREFEMYGPIRKIKLISDKFTGKPRGYAYIEYEHERDMHSAYKHADGKKIDGRRVLVDVERGRTVKGWRPRRLGGGLGGTRKGGPEENTRFSGRDEYGGRDAGGFGGRPDRGDRDESRERDRRPRRSRSRERDRGDRRRRSRSRDRKREGDDEDRDRRKRSRRSRSRDKDAKKGRSRSPKDKERGDRDRGDRDRGDRAERADRGDKDRDRERRRRRSRSRDRKKKGEEQPAQPGAGGEFGEVQIKQEPMDDDGYPSYPAPPLPTNGDAAAPPPAEPDEGEYGEYDGVPVADM